MLGLQGYRGHHPGPQENFSATVGSLMEQGTRISWTEIGPYSLLGWGPS